MFNLLRSKEARMQIRAISNTLLLVGVICATSLAAASRWRTATSQELRKIIPARAPVVNENIETEFRTASGVTDGHGKFIAGVVMITAGYAAEGKYSYFFSTQVAIKVGDMELKPGEYVFGSHRTDEQTLEIKFYEAATGKYLGAVQAIADKPRGPIRSLGISPPENGKGSVKVG